MSGSFDELVDIMTRLRGEKGCPWDQLQTHKSLIPYLIEESHEVIEAIDSEDRGHLTEELGDLLLQVIFHAEIAREKGEFSIEEVLKGLIEKLKSRHPHVFGDTKLHSAEQVLMNWEKNKMMEKSGSRESCLDGVPPSLPALMRAQKIQKKASKIGFDWTQKKEVVAKFEEEWKEFKGALETNCPEEIEDEAGDLFFTLVNLARSLKLDSEQLLRGSTEKFIKRFRKMEDESKRRGVLLENLTAEEWDQLWLMAKKQEGSS
ncbi:MAG: nucleoside triphosphate pyrophosphohydrolase [Nitrospirae bacterium]|nr:nucleoside triphosphate pyrophosphohydrolase [Nitrospirota bacterium]